MKRQTKDNVAIISACCLLFFAVCLTTAGFIVSPVGEVDNSVLWIFGQCLLYAGSIFGIGIYVKGKVEEMKEDIDKYVKKD